MATKQTKEFDALATQVLQSQKGQEITVRNLVSLFGQAKRGREVNRFIKYKLRYNGLETVPHFDKSHIDSVVCVQIKKLQSVESQKQPTGGAPAPSPKQPKPVEIVREIEADEDASSLITVGLVLPPGRVMHTVRPSDSCSKVVTLLMMEHVEYIVVLQSPRKAEGLVTWHSLGIAMHSGRSTTTAADCMERNPRVINIHTPLLKAIEEVLRFGAVLVEAEDKTIKDIFTADDVAKQFILSAQPFLLLEEIENRIRRLMRKASFKADEIKNFVDPGDVKRREKICKIEDLTFGEYLRALQFGEIWKRIKIPLEQSLFVNRLDEVREIRNSVMHFHPDGITGEERKILIGFLELLHRL